MIGLREVEANADVLQAFARLREARADMTGGLQSAADLISGCRVFALDVDGVAAVYYALRVVEHDYGREGVVDAIALANKTTRGLGQTQLQTASAMIDLQFRNAGCASVSMVTRRRGMVREAARAGYEIEGFQMRKTLCAMNS